MLLRVDEDCEGWTEAANVAGNCEAEPVIWVPVLDILLERELWSEYGFVGEPVYSASVLETGRFKEDVAPLVVVETLDVTEAWDFLKEKALWSGLLAVLEEKAWALAPDEEVVLSWEGEEYNNVFLLKEAVKDACDAGGPDGWVLMVLLLPSDGCDCIEAERPPRVEEMDNKGVWCVFADGETRYVSFGRLDAE